MKTASVAEVKAKLSAYIKASENGPIVVTRNGRAVAVLVTPDSEEDLERLLFAYSRHLRRILDASRRSIESGQGIPHDKFWRELESSAPKKIPKESRLGRRRKQGADGR